MLVLTALWHGAAAWHFTLYPERTLDRTTEQRPIESIPAELFRFLGGLNVALVVLGLWAAFAPPAVWEVAGGVLAVANATQFLQDLRVRRLGIARGPFFAQILVGDAVFTVFNVAVAWMAGGA